MTRPGPENKTIRPFMATGGRALSALRKPRSVRCDDGHENTPDAMPTAWRAPLRSRSAVFRASAAVLIAQRFAAALGMSLRVRGSDAVGGVGD